MHEKLAKLAREAAADYQLGVKYTGRKHMPSWLDGYFKVAADRDVTLKGHRRAFGEMAQAEIAKGATS